MSKRTKKDIKIISEGIDTIPARSNSLVGAEHALPEFSIDTPVVKKPAVRRTTKAKTAVIKNEVAEQDDVELQALLLQVDTMLTEMTQSKWMSQDWPSLELDLGKGKI